MGTIDPRSLRAVVKTVLGVPQRKPEDLEKDSERDDSIVSRRDERGQPYRGDFPNPASDRTRGCF